MEDTALKKVKRDSFVLSVEEDLMNMKKCKCGGIADIHIWEIEEDDERQYIFDMYYVECEECHKRIPILQFTEDDAINQWNEIYADMSKEKLEEEVI